MSTVIDKRAKAERYARDGYGWADLVVMCGLTEAEARYIVFGFPAYRRWRERQERKAS